MLKIFQKKCKHCRDINKLDWQLGEEGAPHHGEYTICDECGAEYYREYYGDDFASNQQALINHRKLRTS